MSEKLTPETPGEGSREVQGLSGVWGLVTGDSSTDRCLEARWGPEVWGRPQLQKDEGQTLQDTELRWILIYLSPKSILIIMNLEFTEYCRLLCI